MRNRAVSGRASVSARPIGEVVAPLVERVSPFDGIPEAPLVEKPLFPIEPPDTWIATEQSRQETLLRSLACWPSVIVFSVPNEGRKSDWERLTRWKGGARSGAPDLLFFWPGGHAAIEMKSGKGRLSQNQIETLNRLHLAGHPVAVWRSPDRALDWLRDLGAPIQKTL